MINQKVSLTKRKMMIADMILNNKMYVPMKAKEIASLLQVPRDERHVLQEILDIACQRRNNQYFKKGKYKKPDKNRVVGELFMKVQKRALAL